MAVVTSCENQELDPPLGGRSFSLSTNNSFCKVAPLFAILPFQSLSNSTYRVPYYTVIELGKSTAFIDLDSIQRQISIS